MIKYLDKIRKRFFRLFGKSNNYYRDYYYHHLIDQYNDNCAYFSLYKKCTSDKSLKTNVKICFSKSLKLGSNRADICRILGKPGYHIKNVSPLNIEILVYRMLIGNHKVTCQMHLFDNQLFLYNYTFPYSNGYDNEQIMNIIQKKYLPETGNYAAENIIDGFNNCLQIEKGVDFTISYLLLTCDFFLKNTAISADKEARLIRQNRANYRQIYDRV